MAVKTGEGRAQSQREAVAGRTMADIRAAWVRVALDKPGPITFVHEGPKWAVLKFIAEMAAHSKITAKSDALGRKHEITTRPLTEQERQALLAAG